MSRCRRAFFPRFRFFHHRQNVGAVVQLAREAAFAGATRAFCSAAAALWYRPGSRPPWLAPPWLAPPWSRPLREENTLPSTHSNPIHRLSLLLEQLLTAVKESVGVDAHPARCGYASQKMYDYKLRDREHSTPHPLRRPHPQRNCHPTTSKSKATFTSGMPEPTQFTVAPGSEATGFPTARATP